MSVLIPALIVLAAAAAMEAVANPMLDGLQAVALTQLRRAASDLAPEPSRTTNHPQRHSHVSRRPRSHERRRVATRRRQHRHDATRAQRLDVVARAALVPQHGVDRAHRLAGLAHQLR